MIDPTQPSNSARRRRRGSILPQPAKKGKPSGTPRKRRGVKLKPTDLAPKDLAVVVMPDEIHDLAAAVERDGGAVLATYREPLGGHIVLLCALPIDKWRPPRSSVTCPTRTCVVSLKRWTRRSASSIRSSPSARNARRRTATRPKVYWIPNGYHRLTALQELGAKTLLALVVPRDGRRLPDPRAQHREGAQPARARARRRAHVSRPHRHQPQDRARGLARARVRRGALPTLGFAYEKRPRLSGGAYHPGPPEGRRLDREPLATALADAEARAAPCSSSTTRSAPSSTSSRSAASRARTSARS
jgi:ParB family chromosome partitioning protein